MPPLARPLIWMGSLAAAVLVIAIVTHQSLPVILVLAGVFAAIAVPLMWGYAIAMRAEVGK